MLQFCLNPERLFPFAVPRNVQKRKARPKRSIAKPGDDHNAGLWVDYDLLRKHQGRSPEVVLHSPQMGVNNRYLELADIALGTNTSKKKTKAATTNP
jgi:hypothetical protein